MKEAIENGINVIVKPTNNQTFNELNDDAHYVLSSSINENDDDIIIGNSRDLIIKNRKTGKGAIFNFD